MTLLCVSAVLLLRWYEIEFPRPFLIKQCAFRFVATAPMFVATRDSEEISRPHTLFALIILVEISALDNDQPHVARVRVHPRVISRRELRKCSVRPFVRVAPKDGHGDTCRRRRWTECRLLRSHIDHVLLTLARLFLGLRNTNRRRAN